MAAKDPHALADKLYRDILDMVEELVAVYADAENSEDDDGEGFNLEEVLDGVVEEAAERGLDEQASSRVFNMIDALAKKSVRG